MRSRNDVADISNAGFTVAPGFYTRVAIQRQEVSARGSNVFLLTAYNF